MPGIAADTSPQNSTPTASEERLAVERALEELAALSPRTARILELHYFRHLPLCSIAIVLNLSPSIVAQALRFAKAWLLTRLKR
jgi:DNA-directed RNA polymerase specialized sigma24 family protein